MSSRTAYAMLEETAARLGGAAALHQPYAGDGKRGYRRFAWSEFRDAAREVAVALVSLGIRKGDVVAIASETRAELYIADFGIMACGAVSAALYTSYPAADLVRTLRACRARAVFAEDPKMLQRLEGAAAAPLDVRWILLTGRAEEGIALDDLRQAGREAMARDPELWPRISRDVRPEDPAILYLTSGATGEPKMALVAHRALVANADIGPEVLNAGPQDSTLAFLPSAHITQRVVIELIAVRCGVPVWFSESLLRLPQELMAVEPTLFVAPPRLWERIYKTVRAEIGKRPAPVRAVFYAALGVGLRVAELRQQGRPVPVWMEQARKLADRLVYRKLRERFGRRLRFAASGAAPLGAGLARFYLAIGVPLHEGYGLTEGGIVVLNPMGRQKPGSIGRPLPGVEVRLAPDGELLVRCPFFFLGYFQDPQATAAALRGGWLHTGDLCEIDEEGYLFLTGRKKELVVTSSGRKIYPAHIEDLFKTEPVVSHVLLVGDRLPYPAALITVNPAAGSPADPKTAEEVRRAVARVNARLPEFERIHKYRILDRDFTIEDGELTSTLKLRRERILENHRAVIEELYGP
jgi:long-chain acyl-CoA synthetase